MDDGSDLDRDSGRSHYGRGAESYRHSDRQSSRGSRSYHGHHRRNKYADVDDRDYSRFRSGRDSRNNIYSDYSRRETDHQSGEYTRDDDKYSRDKSDGLDRSRNKEREKDSSSEYQKHAEKDLTSDRVGSGRRHSNIDDLKYRERDRYKDDKAGMDEKIDHRQSSGDYRSDHLPAYEGSRSHRNDLTSRRDSSGHHVREIMQNGLKSFDCGNYTREEKKNRDDGDRYKERHPREPGKLSEAGNGHFTKVDESSAKKPQLSAFDVINSAADGKPSLSSKHPQGIAGEGPTEQACLTDSDIDAAKVVAMKAAELVNRNLMGTGFMSADQKKKLLWGNKKTAAKEESANHWDTTILGDRERQEKFHKLMGVKGEVKTEPKPDNEAVEKQREQLQMDLEKQYTAGLRRRDGRTVGLGL